MALLDTEIDEELEDDANLAIETEESENGDEQSSVAAPEEGEESGEADDQDVITLKGETPEEANGAPKGPAPKWVKTVRDQNKALKKELQELRAQVQAPQSSQLRAKPTLADSQYDEIKFAEALEAWHEEKRVKVDEPKAKAQREQEQADQELRAKQAKYNQNKVALKVKNFAEAEENVTEALTDVQQGLLLELARPEVAVYVLGTRPKLLAELAVLTPAKFAIRMGKLEAELSVERKAGVAPEARVPRTAGAGSASAINSEAAYKRELDRLEKEYDRTGDRTAIRKLNERWNSRNAGR